MDSEGHGVVLWTVASFLGLRSSEVSGFSKLWVMVAGFDVLKWVGGLEHRFTNNPNFKP